MTGKYKLTVILEGNIRIGAFDRWYIFHAFDDQLAWSGSRWMPCTAEGLPTGEAQVCNFASRKEAAEYCIEHGIQAHPLPHI